MQFLANLKIGQKIYLVLAIISLFAIGVGLFGLNGIKSSNNSLKTVYEDRVVPLQQLKTVADMYAVNIVDTCHKVRNGNLSWAEGLDNIDKADEVIKQQWGTYLTTKMDAKEAKLAQEAETLMKSADLSIGKAQTIMKQQDREALANYTIVELYPNIEPISLKITDLMDLQLEVAKQKYDEAENNYHTLFTIFISILIIGIVLALFIAVVIVRMITTQIDTMINSIHKDENGYITIQEFQVSSHDEIGQLGIALNTLIAQVRGFVNNVSESAGSLAASSEELTASAEQSANASSQVAESITSVASMAEKQEKSIDKSSMVIEQMSASMQHIVDSTLMMGETSKKAAHAANQGGKVINTVITQMSTIEKSVITSAEVVAKLDERSKDIGQIVDTIAGIAGQTNLLALNAAIEAARAGEQGRGFAVVADEVRMLAEQSQEAAKQIANLIAEIQSETDRALTAMNNGTLEVKTGGEVVNTAGQAFEQIESLVNLVFGQVNDISSAIQQIGSDSQQIVVAIRDIDTVSKITAEETQTVSAATEEQTASMEEIAAATQVLSATAEDLHEAVRQFKI